MLVSSAVTRRLVAYGEDPLVAVSAARLHHQLLPDIVAAEDESSGGLSIRVDPQTVQVS